MLTFIQDVRYGWRMLHKNPGFAAVAIITLAVGIGANVAIFSYVDELWLHPLPVPHPDRVVRIFTSNPSSKGEIEQGYNSYPDFEYLRANATTLSGVALHESRGAMLDTGNENKHLTASVVSDNFFDVLQPKPAVGRMFTESEFQSGGAPRIVISYPFWQRQYNSDPAIAGQTIIVDRQHVTVVGVLPRSFRSTEAMLVQDVWIPISTWKQLIGVEQRLTLRGERDYELFGRLRDTATLSQAQAQLAGISTQLAHAYPETNTGRKMTVISESHARADVIVKFGLFLLGVAALVLLIACSNVSSLLIARTEYRRHEIATRIALGATRTRIVCQMLTETVMLALIGAVAAIWVGSTLLHGLPKLMPQMSFSIGVDAYLSSRGLAVALLATVGSMLVFGLAPAVLASRTVPADTFRHRTETGKVRSVIRNVLVIGQVALSLVLVVTTGLLTRSLLYALGMDPGFNAHQQMLVIELVPETGKTASDVSFVREARRRIEALPGAGPTTIAMRIPFGMSGGGATHKVFVPGSLASTDPQGTTINFDPVADHFFDVLGTRMLRGRAIDEHDIETKARVIVVNQQMASRFWPDDDPINKRVRLERMDGDEYIVIGVAEDGKYSEFEENPKPYFFRPMNPGEYDELCMVVKTSADAGTLAGPVRKVLHDLNPNVYIVGLLTLREHVRQALYGQRVAANLIAALGTLGLLLAAVGIYGLMSFVVRRRTQEIGIRLALGVPRTGVFRLVIGQALVLGAMGVIFGTVGAYASGNTIRTLLVGVGPADVLAFAAGIIVLLLVTLLAAAVPALKATRVDPIVALRNE